MACFQGHYVSTAQQVLTFSLLFMSLQQFAVADTALQPSGEVATPLISYFTELGVDQAVWDALHEGVLAIIVFGAASVMLAGYRSHTSKSSPPKKPNVTCHVPQTPAPNRAGARADGARSCSSRMAAASGRPELEPAQRRPTIAYAAGKSSESVADALVKAVKAGKAAYLPQLLDKALTRSSAVAGPEHSQATAEEMATGLLHSALRACAANHCFGDAITAYQHMAGRIGGGSSGMWSVLLYCIVEARTYDLFQQVFENLCKQGKPSGHDFVNLVRCYISQHDAEGLRKALARLCASDHFIDSYTWNRALASCSASESVLPMSDTLVDSGICLEGLDAVGYNTLMKYNAHAGKYSRCFELHKEMLAKGLEASEVTFGILLDACVASKDLDFSKKVFDDLCSSEVRLNVVHCTTFIKSLLAANDFDGAATVLSEMATSSGVKPDLITYSTVIKAYADAGDVRGGLQILQQMMQGALKPDEILFNCLLAGCSVFPMKSDDIMQTFQTLMGFGMRPSTTTLSIVLKGLAQTQAWTVSLQLLKDAPQTLRVEPETRLFVQLAQACLKSRAAAEVVDIFDAMLEAVRRRHEQVDPALISRVLRSCTQSGENRLAAQLQEAAARAAVTAASPSWHAEKTSGTCTTKPRPQLVAASHPGSLTGSLSDSSSIGLRPPWMKANRDGQAVRR